MKRWIVARRNFAFEHEHGSQINIKTKYVATGVRGQSAVSLPWLPSELNRFNNSSACWFPSSAARFKSACAASALPFWWCAPARSRRVWTCSPSSQDWSVNTVFPLTVHLNISAWLQSCKLGYTHPRIFSVFPRWAPDHFLALSFSHLHYANRRQW